MTAVDAGAFEGCSKLADLSLGSSVTTVQRRAFADCGLAALVLPDNVMSLGSEVFAGNPTLASVKFGAGITAVSDRAFAGNDVIERLTIPKTVEAIGAGAFAGWSKLNTLTVSGDALASIGSKAFENAVLLADIYCEPTTAPTVAADSFGGGGRFGSGRQDRPRPVGRRLFGVDCGVQRSYIRRIGRRLPERRRLLPRFGRRQVVCGTSGILLDALRVTTRQGTIRR